MKNTLSLLLVFFLTVTAYSQSKLETTFKKYKNDEGVTSLTFDEKIMDFLKSDDNDWKTRIEKVEILIFNSDRDLRKSDLDKINAAIDSDQYELLINAKSKEGKAKMYGLSEGEALKSLYAQVHSDEANIYFMLRGTIYLEELPQMGLDFQGANAFKFFEEEKKKAEDSEKN